MMMFFVFSFLLLSVDALLRLSYSQFVRRELSLELDAEERKRRKRKER